MDKKFYVAEVDVSDGRLENDSSKNAESSTIHAKESDRLKTTESVR